MLVCRLVDVSHARARESTSLNSVNSTFFIALAGGESECGTNLTVLLISGDELAVTSR